MDEKNKTVAEQITEKRIENLRKMHDRMLHMNNENAYMWWIEYMPDEPSDDDFASIAEDDEQYEEMVEVFLKVLTRYGKDGFWKE